MDQHALDGPSLNRLHDLAKAEAERLRREAMRDFGNEVMDDFWRGANALWQRGQTTDQRSAARLRARLAAADRQNSTETLPSDDHMAQRGATLLTPRCQQPRRIIKASLTHRNKSS